VGNHLEFISTETKEESCEIEDDTNPPYNVAPPHWWGRRIRWVRFVSCWCV